MSKKISLLFSILLIVYSYCSECTDKTSFKSDEDPSLCFSLSTTDENNQTSCIYDPSTLGCVELECQNFPYDSCHDFKYNDRVSKRCISNYETRKCQTKRCSDFPIDKCHDFGRHGDLDCVPNEEKTSCVSSSCENLPISQCQLYHTENFGEQCILNSERTGCEIKHCMDMDYTNCDDFIPSQVQFKCAQVEGEERCDIIKKECTTLKSPDCDSYNEYWDGDIYDIKRCMKDKDSNDCIFKKCNELLSKDDCDRYPVNDIGTKCIHDGEKCKFSSCYDLPSNQCGDFIPDDNDYKCVNSNGKCKIISCSNDADPSQCEVFKPNNPIYKCALDEEELRCSLQYKKCEEMDKDKCEERFYFNDEYDDVGQDFEDDDEVKCVYSKEKDKCQWVVNKKNYGGNYLKFPFIGICLLSFIFNH